MAKSVPKIGSDEYLREVTTAFQETYQYLADRYTDGDQKKLMDQIALTITFRVGENPAGEIVAGLNVGRSKLLMRGASHAIHTIAQEKSKDTGMDPIRAAIGINAEILGLICNMHSQEDAMKMPISKTEAEKLREDLKKLSLDDIRKLED